MTGGQESTVAAGMGIQVEPREGGAGASAERAGHTEGHSGHLLTDGRTN